MGILNDVKQKVTGVGEEIKGKGEKGGRSVKSKVKGVWDETKGKIRQKSADINMEAEKEKAKLNKE